MTTNEYEQQKKVIEAVSQVCQVMVGILTVKIYEAPFYTKPYYWFKRLKWQDRVQWYKKQLDNLEKSVR